MLVVGVVKMSLDVKAAAILGYQKGHCLSVLQSGKFAQTISMVAVKDLHVREVSGGANVRAEDKYDFGSFQKPMYRAS